MYTAWDFLRNNVFVKDDNFLAGVMDLEISFLSSPAPVACTGGVYAGVPYSNRSLCINAARFEVTSIESTDIKGTYTRDICTRVINDTDIKSACIKNAYI